MNAPQFQTPSTKTDVHPRTLAVFLTAGLIGSVAVMPYLVSLYGGETSLAAAVGIAVLTAAAAVVAMYLGLRWGVALGLGAPRVQSWAFDRADPGGWGATLGWSVPIAVALSGFVYVAEHYWYAGAFTLMYADKSLVRGVGAAIYAGTAEEFVLRLFAMTGIARALLWAKVPRARAIVGSLLLSGLLSTAFHLPASLAFHPLSWPTVGHVFVHHGMGGFVFGWLYWRRGIEAAMVAHGLSELLLRFWLLA